MSWKQQWGFGVLGYPKPEYGRNYVAMNSAGDIIAVTGKDVVTIATDDGKQDQIPIYKYPGLNETDNGYSGSTVSLSGDGQSILIGSKCLTGAEYTIGDHVSQLYTQNVTKQWELKQNFWSKIKSHHSCSSAKLSTDGKTVVISTFNPPDFPGVRIKAGRTDIFVYDAITDNYEKKMNIAKYGLSASISSDGDQVVVSDTNHKSSSLWSVEQQRLVGEMKYSAGKSMSLSCDGQSFATSDYVMYKNQITSKNILQVYDSTSKSWNVTDIYGSNQTFIPGDGMPEAMPVVSISCNSNTDRISIAVIDPHFNLGAIIRREYPKQTFQVAKEFKPVAVAMSKDGNIFALSYKLKEGTSTWTDIYVWSDSQDLSKTNQSFQLKEHQNSFNSILPIFAFISIAFWFFVRRR